MNWLQGLLYGFVSGFTGFLPISSHAHQILLLKLFGIETPDPMVSLLVRCAVLFSLYSGMRAVLEQIRRERKLRTDRRRMHTTYRSLQDFQLVRNAILPQVLLLLLFTYISRMNTGLPTLSVFLLINGVILYIPERMLRGNKDAGIMSYLDSLLLGVSGALSAFSGISHIGTTVSAAVARGADRSKALNWSLLLSFPLLFVFIGIDFFDVISNSEHVHFWQNFFTYLLSATGAYLGGYLGIIFIKFLTPRTSYSGFAYYSWGMALFTFLLYLIAA